jgi:hypothetical protein
MARVAEAKVSIQEKPLAEIGRSQPANSDIHHWTITFADTGLRSNIGQRLKVVEKYLVDEKMF